MVRRMHDILDRGDPRGGTPLARIPGQWHPKVDELAFEKKANNGVVESPKNWRDQMNTRKKILVETLGAVSVILWFLVLGPVGLLAGLGLCHSMMVQNAALGVVCGIILGSPLVILVAWALFAWRAIVREKRADRSWSVRLGAKEQAAERVRA